jgi:phosphoribosyl-ATP pyrophosphohydrolase
MAKPAKAKSKVKSKKPRAEPMPEKARGKSPGKVKAKAAPKAKKLRKSTVALPMPASLPQPAAPVAPRADPGATARAPYAVSGAEAAILDALWRTVEARRLAGDVDNSHSARLLARGTAKVAQKLGEEAVECVIEATQGHRTATVLESADLLYHLIVVWVDAGIRPEEVWSELARRQGISGIAEKASRPKGLIRAAQTTKLP